MRLISVCTLSFHEFSSFTLILILVLLFFCFSFSVLLSACSRALYIIRFRVYTSRAIHGFVGSHNVLFANLGLVPMVFSLLDLGSFCFKRRLCCCCTQDVPCPPLVSFSGLLEIFAAFLSAQRNTCFKLVLISHFLSFLYSRHHVRVLQHFELEREKNRQQLVWRQVFKSYVALLRQRRASSPGDRSIIMFGPACSFVCCGSPTSVTHSCWHALLHGFSTLLLSSFKSLATKTSTSPAYVRLLLFLWSSALATRIR